MARDHTITGDRYWNCARCTRTVRWSDTAMYGGRRVCSDCVDTGPYVPQPHKRFPGYRRQKGEGGVCVWLEEWGAWPQFNTSGEYGVLVGLENLQGRDLDSSAYPLSSISGEYGTLTMMPDFRLPVLGER